MKKTTLIIYIAVLALAAKKKKKGFLDSSSPSEFTSDVVYNSTTYASYALTGIYSLLTQDQMYSARLSG